MAHGLTESCMKAKKKRVNLALQGGGGFGAFAWGVLDAILEDGRLEIASISGTSAGAMNAVALATGMAQGGPEKARENLRHFWLSIPEMAATFSPIMRLIDSPLYSALDLR